MELIPRTLTKRVIAAIGHTPAACSTEFRPPRVFHSSGGKEPIGAHSRCLSSKLSNVCSIRTTTKLALAKPPTWYQQHFQLENITPTRYTQTAVQGKPAALPRRAQTSQDISSHWRRVRQAIAQGRIPMRLVPIGRFDVA